MTVEAYLDRGVRGWIIREAHRQFWRMPSWYTFDDLVQDGYQCAARVAAKYPKLGELKRPGKRHQRQFMALLITTFHNHIHTLAGKTTHGHEEPVSSLVSSYAEDDDVSSFFDVHGHNTMQEGLLKVLLTQAPKELRALLGLLNEDAYKFATRRRVRLGYKPTRDGRERPYITKRAQQERLNTFWCRLLKLDPREIDLPQLMLRHFNVHHEEAVRGLEAPEPIRPAPNPKHWDGEALAGNLEYRASYSNGRLRYFSLD